ncbi:hypothetical protein CHCC14820_1206 [Bacillus paralicheniformis]|nr:hypothetical protein B4123_1330 [Bacillus paralicheniformis]TWJ57556.1 hypothetical protein CHCC5023_3786 [Bacillus paralicheniformis]TWJ80518.1 hypothetical protein CHCC5019_0094 [Bacillus paralicheniformis]TWM29867.1 hypothetical protein CHCC14820_1206 [Bacillus paralicheniformis]TWN94360.1 hypothetical protein CHCC20490_1759 [Bacillus paralicheniformis]
MNFRVFIFKYELYASSLKKVSLFGFIISNELLELSSNFLISFLIFFHK